jgi:hypothetical protein
MSGNCVGHELRTPGGDLEPFAHGRGEPADVAAELSELLREAGFAEVEVYWDVAESDAESRYLVRRSAENCPGWIAYVVGRRGARRRPGSTRRAGRGRGT